MITAELPGKRQIRRFAMTRAMANIPFEEGDTDPEFLAAPNPLPRRPRAKGLAPSSRSIVLKPSLCPWSGKRFFVDEREGNPCERLPKAIRQKTCCFSKNFHSSGDQILAIITAPL